MSSEVSTIFRYQGVEFNGLLSSGMLRKVFYDPAFFNGDAELFAKVKDWQEEYPRVPSNSGIVVMDFDGKRRWDLQSVRNLDLLSGSFDHSWIHYSRLREMGWIAEGLYRMDGSYALPFQGSHKDFEVASAKATGEMDKDGDWSAWLDRAVHLKVQVPGWTNVSFEFGVPDNQATLLAALQQAGFRFSAEELGGWQRQVAGA